MSIGLAESARLTGGQVCTDPRYQEKYADTGEIRTSVIARISSPFQLLADLVESLVRGGQFSLVVSVMVVIVRRRVQLHLGRDVFVGLFRSPICGRRYE